MINKININDFSNMSIMESIKAYIIQYIGTKLSGNILDIKISIKTSMEDLLTEFKIFIVREYNDLLTIKFKISDFDYYYNIEVIYKNIDLQLEKGFLYNINKYKYRSYNNTNNIIGKTGNKWL